MSVSPGFMDWFVRPLIVLLVGGLLLNTCTSQDAGDVKVPTDLEDVDASQQPKDSSVYYSWSYQQVGKARKGTNKDNT